MSRQVDLPQGAALAEWDGACLELVNELLHKHPDGSVLYVEPFEGPWKYHTALVLDGIVHDAWYPDTRLPPEEYVAAVFGAGTPWELISDEDEDS